MGRWREREEGKMEERERMKGAERERERVMADLMKGNEGEG